MEGNEWLLDDNFSHESSLVGEGAQLSDAPLTDEDDPDMAWSPNRPSLVVHSSSNAPAGIVAHVKGLMTQIIDSSTKLIRRPNQDEKEHDPNAEVPTYADELELCYDYQREGSQLAFGAFRFHTSQQMGRPRSVQTIKLPNDIFTSFSVYAANTRHSKNSVSPDGACQSVNERVWVLCRGYGILGGVLPDWFCLNYIKRVTTRLTIEPLDVNQARNIIKHTFQELADDLTSLLEQITSTDHQSDLYASTGVIATGGIWMNETRSCVIGTCGNQQTYHIDVKAHTDPANHPAGIPYGITKPLYRVTHSYTDNPREKARVMSRLLALREKSENDALNHMGSLSSGVSPSHKWRLIAGLREDPIEAVPGTMNTGGSVMPDLEELKAHPDEWCKEIVEASTIGKHNLTRGFGFLKSQTIGLCAVPDFVIVQSRTRKIAIEGLPPEILVVASNDMFWQIRSPQEVTSQLLRCVHIEKKPIGEALDQVCRSVIVESVARGFKSFAKSELIVICIPLV